MNSQARLSFKEKFANLNVLLISLVTLLVGLGFLMLYDAGNGSFYPWAQPQILRFILGMVLMLGVALTPIQIWLKSAYALYAIAFILLCLVEIFGHVGMGAQRWLDLYIFKLQPSELMRLTLILALACYFHRSNPEELKKPSFLISPVLMILAPAAVVTKQPDLGTALLLISVGAGLLFVVGVNIKYFIGAFIAGCAAIPLAWHLLHEYQKKRILIFLNPESDPLASGYHITQSKIALGSGGFFGKGFLKGTQSHLNFLPEKQTDFIFTMFCEEFGMLGALLLIILYMVILGCGLLITLRCQSSFARLISYGIVMTLFVYIFINMAMVMGLVPVVGIPLPMVSYGGTAMLTLMMGFGFLLNADIHRDLRIPRY
jgi:rod shape determining protein RodA